MKIFKKIVIVSLVVLTIIFNPIFVNAAIIEDACEEVMIQNPITVVNSTDIMPLGIGEPFNQNFVRSRIVSITRTNSSTGIELVVNVTCGYDVDFCIFKSGTSQIVGNTKRVSPTGAGFTTIMWSASELTSDLNVDVFMTCYRDVSVRVSGTISY